MQLLKILPICSKKNIYYNKNLLPISKSPILCYMLRNENEVREGFSKSIINNEYVAPELKNNLSILSELERKKIIQPQQPYEPPRFVDNYLTDGAYNDIVQKVKGSSILTSYQKDLYLNKLAVNNYKQNSTSFKGTEEEILSNSALESSQMTDRELELAEIDNIDVSMCNELQEYLEKPLKSAGDGLLDNIVDLSDALIDVGDKTLSSIKNFVLNALDSF